MAVTLLAKRAFRFTNPDPNVPMPSLVQKDAEDTAGRKFCFLPKGEPKECPDWVRRDPIFNWGREDGTLMVIETATPSIVVEQVAENALATQAEEPKASAPPRSRRK